MEVSEGVRRKGGGKEEGRGVDGGLRQLLGQVSPSRLSRPVCLSRALTDMDMADYSEALDPAYTTLEFENMQVLPLGTGESQICACEG